MRVGTIKSNRIYSLDNHPLREVEHTKYLGVTISNDLSWSRHINNISAKGNSKLGFLWRNLSHCHSNIKKQAYVSLVRSTIEYCSSVWDPYLKKDIQELEKVQRRGARFVLNDYHPRSSVSSLLKELGWDSLELRRKKGRIQMFAKILSKTIAIDSTLLEQADSRTRSNHRLKFKNIYARTNSYKNSFFPRTVPTWNGLSESEVEAALQSAKPTTSLH